MKYLLLFLMVLTGAGCQKTDAPHTIHGSIVIMKDGEPVTLGETQVWLFKASEMDEKIAELDRKLEAEKVQIENQISEMEVNYRLWGITRKTPAQERASLIPPDQAAKVAEFEKKRPAFEQKLKENGDFNLRTLLTFPSQEIPVDANHEFSFSLPGQGLFTVVALVKFESKGRGECYPLMIWIREDNIRQGRVVLTEQNSFWADGVRDWMVNKR